ncbi:MAG TPA: MFS transporter, partial [Amycolatopsis sp.]|nr:MFS transporter [Amycolatopsis sp.]
MTAIRDAPVPATGKVRAIITLLMLSLFLAALDQTILSTAIVRIANDLRGFDRQVWIVAAYLICVSVAAPVYGKLSDIYGRRPLFMWAISIFLVSSLVATFAQTVYQLAVLRGVQGVGAGGLMTLSTTIFSDVLPPRAAPRYRGYSVAVYGAATFLGPLIGGSLTDTGTLAGFAGWRWAFLINLPVGLVVLVLAWRALKLPHQRRRQRVDWWGTLALIVAVVPPLIVAELGRTWGWTSRNALIAYAVSAFGLVVFVLVEKRMKDAALIPMQLFANWSFTTAATGCFVVGVAIFAATSLVPQYLQVVDGFSATQAGLLLLPQMTGIMAGSAVTGRLIGTTGHYKRFLIIGAALTAAGALLFAQVRYPAPMWFPLLASVVMGLGFGSCMQPLIVAVQNSSPRDDIGVSTALATFFREVGGTTGIALSLTVLINALPGAVTHAFGGNASPGLITALQKDTGIIPGLPEALRIPVLNGFSEAVTTAFYATTAVALIAMVLLFLLKETPLPAETASPAVHADDALTAPVIAQGDTCASPISGRVRRPNGNPVTRANLTLVDEHGHQAARTTATPDGTYSITAPGPGRYTVIVISDGHRPHASDLTVDGPARLDITLTGIVDLSGVVREAGTGNPIPYATVTVADSRGDVDDTCTTTVAGGYSLTCLGTGPYTL